MRLRSHLVLLVVAALVPPLIFTAYVMRQDLAEQREILDRGMRTTARALSLAVDGEIKSSLAILETLAASDNLDSGDLKGFHELCVRATAGREGAYIVLFDRLGQQLVNSSRPFGVPLPNPLRETKAVSADARYPLLPLGGAAPVRKVLETGRPVVSDLFIALDSRRPTIGINIPVVREGALRYVLEMSIEPEPLVRGLLAQRLPEDFVASLLDSQGLVIARTHNFAGRLGTPLAPQLAAQARKADEGTGEGRTREGMDVVHAFTRSQTTGWTISLGVSQEVIGASMSRSLGLLTGGAAITLILGIGAAIVLGRRISRPISLLAGSAGAMARGEHADLNVSAVRELRELHGALVEAGQAVRERATEHERRLAAEEADRAKDEFLAMLSHELRNPLAALTTAAHVLRAAPPGDAATAGAQGVIERQTQHMVRLIEDLLDITRVRLGKLSLKQETLDLAAVVSEVAQPWRAAGPLAGRATMSMQLSPVWVHADRARLEQIVSNLLDNALKFTPASGEVHVGVRQEGEKAVLQVTDNGRGIARESLSRIFDPFVQGEPTLDGGGDGDGLGLGLALVRRLAELHEGAVSAESDGAGHGAVFTVWFPAVAAVSEPRLAPSKLESGASLRRVLVIEDNHDARQMLGAVLEMDGHEVREAKDGASGLTIAAEVNPDVVVVDIGLPDIDGYEVARRLRAGAGGRTIALIALTGYGGGEDHGRARAAGFDAHLVKPVSMERLAQVIAELAASSRATPA
jgi:signal transduction histidine kinase/ActR/RegA family two-component response regulator